MTDAQKKVMTALHESGSSEAADIATQCGYQDCRAVTRVLDALFRRNLVTISDDGKWTLTNKGVRKTASNGGAQNGRVRLRGRNDGVIVTMREQTTGELDTIHRPGLPKQALKAVCAVIDGAAGDWRIVSISTPASILDDLQGSRHSERWTQGGNNRLGGVEHEPDVRLKTEWAPLNAIGRLDLLEPPPRTVYGYPRNLPPNADDVAA